MKLSRSTFILGFTLACAVAAVALPAMPQPVAYHDFADHRAMFGVANFLDVASNGGFLLVAVVGLVVVYRTRTRFERASERWAYAVFFVGMLLTAVGSAYYHLAPDNPRLFWDRIPMTIAFMALIAAQIGERIDARAGLVLLAPMVLVGMGSVVLWRQTEIAGVGNLMPYAVLQAYSVAALLLLTWLYPSRYTRGSDLYWVFAWYVLAKVLEALDREVLALGHVVSGHSLKHLAAAVAGVVVCRMLMRRTLKVPAAPPEVSAAAPDGARS